MEVVNLVSVIHLVGVSHLVGVTHLVSVTHPCMTTPWRRQVKQQMRCVWILVMTWAPWHTMIQVHPIHLPMGTHLGPYPWFAMILAHPHPLLHLRCPPPVRLPHRLPALPLQMYMVEMNCFTFILFDVFIQAARACTAMISMYYCYFFFQYYNANITHTFIS